MSDSANVSESIRAQAAEKAAQREQLAATHTIGGALPGDPVDQSQPALAGAIERGDLNISPDDLHAMAYVRPYTEPDSFAYRNYCGPGAATTLLSHWDANYPQDVDLDALAQAMNMDPNSGVWVKDIAEPVNHEISRMAGHDVSWYRVGQAQSIDDFRYMLDTDIGQNGVPLITSLMTGGLPGWGGQDVGHIVAVFGYQKDSSGTEWVLYQDTASPASGYSGPTTHVVTLDAFWQAVSQNSCQVW